MISGWFDWGENAALTIGRSDEVPATDIGGSGDSFGVYGHDDAAGVAHGAVWGGARDDVAKDVWDVFFFAFCIVQAGTDVLFSFFAGDRWYQGYSDGGGCNYDVASELI